MLSILKVRRYLARGWRNKPNNSSLAGLVDSIRADSPNRVTIYHGQDAKTECMGKVLGWRAIERSRRIPKLSSDTIVEPAQECSQRIDVARCGGIGVKDIENCPMLPERGI